MEKSSDTSNPLEKHGETQHSKQMIQQIVQAERMPEKRCPGWTDNHYVKHACGWMIKCRVAHTDRNKGRRYYACSHGKSGEAPTWFEWVDPEFVSWQAMYQLRAELLGEIETLTKALNETREMVDAINDIWQNKDHFHKVAKNVIS